jgi:DNA mismatch repair protein MutL
VHDFVRDTVREALMESRPVSSIPLPLSPAPVAMAKPAYEPQRAGSLPFSEFSARVDTVVLEETPSLAPQEQSIAHLPELRVASPTTPPRMAEPAEPIPEPASTGAKIPDTHGGLAHLPAGWDRLDNLGSLPDLRPMGQLHDSFIIAAGRDGLWIVDQHVAHERILFEQVLRNRAAGRTETQRLLMPMVLELTPAQHFEYARIADELNAHGFETEPFGKRTIAIQAAPAAVAPGDIERIVYEILEIAERELRSASLEEIRRNVCATIACRAAIKINTPLDGKKIEWLLRALAACEYPMTCPHGRPIALRYGTRDILKSFHRL